MPRDPRLDGLRGIAILLVVLYHASISLSAFVEPMALSDVGIGAFERFAFLGTLLGWSGVDLFFVLSGFLITGILLRTRDAPGYYRNFYARRALRILPLYYVVLGVFFFWIANEPSLAAYSWTTDPPPSQAWYWVFLPNILQGMQGTFVHACLGVTWSLAIEEQFYLVWPAVVRVVRGRWFPILCAVMIGSALALRLALSGADAAFTWIYTFPLCRMDALAAGALVAWCFRSDAARAKCLRWAPFALGGALIALGLLVAGILNGAGPDDRKTAIFLQAPLMLTAGLTVLTVVYASTLAMLAGARRSNGGARLFAAAPLRMFGRHSYALYLVHAPILYFVATSLFHPMMPSGAEGHVFGNALLAYGTFTAIALALSLIPAYLAWIAIERPLLSLKRHFPYGAPVPGSRSQDTRN